MSKFFSDLAILCLVIFAILMVSSILADFYNKPLALTLLCIGIVIAILGLIFYVLKLIHKK